MLITIIFTAIVSIILLILFLMAGSSYKEFIADYKADFQLLVFAPPALVLIDKLKIMQRLSTRMVPLQQKIATLYEGRYAPQFTKMFLAQMISLVFVCFLGGGVLAILGGFDTRIVVAGVIFGLIIPYALLKKLDEKADKRKKDIIFELPEFVSKVAMLVGAGETVQKAIIHCTKTKIDDPNPLYTELNNAVTNLENGESFNMVMEVLSKRCGVQEVSILTTSILLNYRRGGSELTAALRELSRDLWEKRKVISRTRGEEASSKLVFPMVLIFVAVLLIIAYPALRILG